MSRQASEEALGIDPRDLDLRMDLRKLLQTSEPAPFKDQTAWDQANAKAAPPKTILTRDLLSDKANTTE